MYDWKEIGRLAINIEGCKKCEKLISNADLDKESWKILYNLIKDQIELRKTNDCSIKD
jgi:hypothetical protein